MKECAMGKSFANSTNVQIITNLEFAKLEHGYSYFDIGDTGRCDRYCRQYSSGPSWHPCELGGTASSLYLGKRCKCDGRSDGSQHSDCLGSCRGNCFGCGLYSSDVSDQGHGRKQACRKGSDGRTYHRNNLYSCRNDHGIFPRCLSGRNVLG